MEDELLKYLYDIREAASAILRFVRGKTFDEYEQDELLRSGVERKFEILGEAGCATASQRALRMIPLD